jgi:hypothetical protein
MNPLRAIGQLFRSKPAASPVPEFQNRYRGADMYSPDREQLFGRPRDIRWDLNNATRSQLVLWSRELEENNGIYNKLLDLFEQYTVGPKGLQFIPNTSDTEWNRKAREWWTGWERVCDLTSLQHFGTIQSLIARTWFKDGEIFILKTYGRDRDGVRRPRIQLIECQRVRSPLSPPLPLRIFDGVEVNDIGRPVAYWISSGLDDKDVVRVDAANIVHVFEPTRANQYRGIPIPYPVMNDMIDLRQLQGYEMLKAKDNANTSRVFKTNTGDVPPGQVMQAKFSAAGTTNTGAATVEARTRYLEKATGATIIGLLPNEEMADHVSSGISAGSQYQHDYMLSQICAGVGISKLLVFPSSMQGTVVRADLDTCNQFFRSRSEVIANAVMLIYQWALGEAIFANENGLGINVPSDYRKVTVRPPRSPNVDVGRNSSALIAEYAAGWRTLEGICGEMGEDWVEVLRQRASELKAAKDIETEFELPAGSLIESALETLATTAEIDAAKQPLAIAE